MDTEGSKDKCSVHTVKFFKLEPKAISCVVYDGKSNLALSRSDASVEVWNVQAVPFLTKVIPSPADGSVEALCWCGDRLFSVGLHGLLVEYDLVALVPKSSTLVTGRAAWCLDRSPSLTRLAVGTEEGYLSLYQLVDDAVQYEKLMDKQEGRILCLRFDKTGNFVVTGSVDAIRVWDVKTGHAIHRMTPGRAENNKETIVWCLAVTDGFTIISGDSRGIVSFWDGELGARIEKYDTHKADVLSICLSEDERTFYCSGVDPLILSFQLVHVKESKRKWVKSIQRVVHDHDVRALVLVEKRLFSAGVDGYLCCSSYPPRELVKHPPIGWRTAVRLAEAARCLLLQHAARLEVWRLAELAEPAGKPRKLLTLHSGKEEAIVCSAIASNAAWIAYSTGSVFRLFSFDLSSEIPELTEATYLPEPCTPCILTEFTPDSKQLLCATRNGEIVVLEFSDDGPELCQQLEAKIIIKDSITAMTVSPSCKYFAASDALSNVAVWSRTESSDWVFCYSMPKYEFGITAMAINPIGDQLIIVYSDDKIVVGNLHAKSVSTLTGVSLHMLPPDWRKRTTAIRHVTFDPRKHNGIILHDDENIYVLRNNIVKQEKVKKRARLNVSKTPGTWEVIVLKKQEHLVHVEWLGDNEMVAVEVSALSLIEQLPPAFPRHRYGTK